MPSTFERRLAKIEVHKAGSPSYVIELPHDAWTHGDEHLEQVTADAIRERQTRTGYRGAVLVGPEPCATEAEWTARYCVPERGR